MIFRPRTDELESRANVRTRSGVMESGLAMATRGQEREKEEKRKREREREREREGKVVA